MVDVLVVRFPDLIDPVVGTVVKNAVARQLADPQPNFEVILDHPAAANWRLKADSPDRSRCASGTSGCSGTSPDAGPEKANAKLTALA